MGTPRTDPSGVRSIAIAGPDGFISRDGVGVLPDTDTFTPAPPDAPTAANTTASAAAAAAAAATATAPTATAGAPAAAPPVIAPTTAVSNQLMAGRNRPIRI